MANKPKFITSTPGKLGYLSMWTLGTKIKYISIVLCKTTLKKKTLLDKYNEWEVACGEMRRKGGICVKLILVSPSFILVSSSI